MMTPKFRQTIYLLGTLVSGVVSIAMLWNGISADTAASLTSIIAGLGGLFGTGAAGTAAVVVSKQSKEGVFDATNPVDAVINGAQAVLDSVETANANLEKIKGVIPSLGPLAEQIISRSLGK